MLARALSHSFVVSSHSIQRVLRLLKVVTANLVHDHFKAAHSGKRCSVRSKSQPIHKSHLRLVRLARAASGGFCFSK